ncbi:MAG: isoprenylcysteine carboxylmethyltransferase family protein [Candidatus Saccharicenans sp.]|nr:isoprenylcysteine carboxylmethyltransferase family protein [Candidatus Saccharicenans sp.]
MRKVFWTITFFWWAMDFYLLVLKRKGGHRISERKSKFIMMMLIFAGVLLAIVPESFRAVWRTRPFGLWQVAGTFILASGVLLRFLSVLHLGKHFAPDIGFRHDRELVTTGLYRWSRHPSYTGEIIAFIGLGIIFQHFPASLFIVLFPAAAFIYRAIVEEKLLIEEFGQEYLEYRKKTRMFV